MWSPYEGLNNLISLLNHSSIEVRQGALLGVGLACNGIYNPNEDLPLNAMFSTLSSPLTGSFASGCTTYAAALLSLALSYANTAKEEVIPYLLKGLKEGNLETAAAASIASGLIFCGRRPEVLITPILEHLSHVNDTTESQLNYLLIGFGLSMLYMVGSFIGVSFIG